MTWPTPTPEEQVCFRRNVQRLLAEGLFVASYKYALLHALADLAVLKGEDSGAPLDLTTREIAEKFVELYWRQCRPFQISGATSSLILRRNTGQRATIIAQIVELQDRCGASLFRLQQVASVSWSDLVTQVAEVVRTMPLWRLQTVGKERLDFPYENRGHGNRRHSACHESGLMPAAARTWAGSARRRSSRLGSNSARTRSFSARTAAFSDATAT
jgi:hypothetical protein